MKSQRVAAKERLAWASGLPLPCSPRAVFTDSTHHPALFVEEIKIASVCEGSCPQLLPPAPAWDRSGCCTERLIKNGSTVLFSTKLKLLKLAVWINISRGSLQLPTNTVWCLAGGSCLSQLGLRGSPSVAPLMCPLGHAWAQPQVTFV